MKKLALLIITIAFCCCACSKYCTCSITNNNNSSNAQNIQEFEVGYNEDCANYSNDNLSCK